jgi:hypothetical protein
MPAMFLYTDYGRAEEPHDDGGVVAKLFHNPISYLGFKTESEQSAHSATFKTAHSATNYRANPTTILMAHRTSRSLKVVQCDQTSVLRHFYHVG